MNDQWNVVEAWRCLTGWLQTNAPVSYASLLPPAAEQAIEAADTQLKHHLGFGLPAELAALWRLCGGVDHQEIEHDEEGEVGSGAFLPGGVIMSPIDALRPPAGPYWTGSVARRAGGAVADRG